MAPPKKEGKTPPKPKPSRPRKRRKHSLAFQLKRSALGLAALILLVVGGAYLLREWGPSPKKQPAETMVSKKIPVSPEFEIYPREPAEKEPKEPVKKPEEQKEAPKAPAERKDLPRVAIIIDDIGYDRDFAQKLMGLNASFTLSILPFSPHGEEISQAAGKKGLEIMLHLPMEPEEYPKVDPGEGALLTSMSPDVLDRKLMEDIRAVPGARGVNNHMGSRMTASSSQMYQIFTTLKKENLFFVDSRTSGSSLCKPSARLLQVPFAERDVFLDNTATAEAVRKQLRELIGKAEKEGRAVGIGHPHPETYQALKEMLPELRQKVRLVPISDLVAKIG